MSFATRFASRGGKTGLATAMALVLSASPILGPDRSAAELRRSRVRSSPVPPLRRPAGSGGPSAGARRSRPSSRRRRSRIPVRRSFR